MNTKRLLITITAITPVFLGASNASDSLKQYGIERQTTDTYNARTDTYKKEFGKTESGNGYGVYGSSTRQFNNSHGERDTSANEVQDGGSKGVGVYITY